MSMKGQNYNIDELRRLDVAHHLPPHQDHQMMQRIGGSRIITHADGVYVYDGDGKAIIDGMAGLWCVQVGYGRKELADAAYEQMLELPYYNSFFKTTTPPTVLLATKLSELLGGHFSHVLFANSGSEAVDTLIRTARYYWQLKGKPERSIIISRVNSYHGSTIAGASLGGMKAMHEQGGPWLPGIEHVMQPYQFEEGFGEDPEHFAKRAADAIEQRILEVGPEKVAAVIGEPVQGAGGVIIPPDGYWPRVEAICRKYGALLISDEVICGFGRLGKWFGFQHYGIKPDLVSMAKGLSSGYLPISAVGMADHIVEALRSVDKDYVHGFTYSGHPTCAAVALRNLAIIERENLVQRTAEDTGVYLAKLMKKLSAHPLVGEARSLGLIGAVEIVSKKGTNQRFKDGDGSAALTIRDICIENGLMVRAVRNSLVMSPPLVISHAELDRMFEILWKSLDQAEAELRSPVHAG
ncbi:MAG: aminotransferase class III-fold pyridoxal phosphate-dependent enzyme [Alphaproteobacteria bacterium]|nr:aminotransferase class III-fold pyridoxal phosphate-dependent enzyme [Alphaproteobacteria bacterium]